jgi:hypothetical protein
MIPFLREMGCQGKLIAVDPKNLNLPAAGQIPRLPCLRPQIDGISARSIRTTHARYCNTSRRKISPLICRLLLNPPEQSLETADRDQKAMTRFAGRACFAGSKDSKQAVLLSYDRS